MKTMCLNRIRCLAAVVLMLLGLLLTCYSVVADARRGGMQEASSEVGVSPEVNDDEPDYVEKRREFLDRFFSNGPGGVSPSDYASALDAARPKATGTRKQCGSFKLQEASGLVNSCGCQMCHDRLAKSRLHNTRDTPG